MIFSAANNSRYVRVCFCFRWDDGRRRCQTKGTWGNVKRCTLFILVFTINHANDIHRMTTPWSIGATRCTTSTKDWNKRSAKKSFYYANKRNKYFEYVWSWFYFSFFLLPSFLLLLRTVFAQSIGICNELSSLLHAYACTLYISISVYFVYTNYPIRKKTESLNDPPGLIHLRLYIFCASYIVFHRQSLSSFFTSVSTTLSVWV